MRNILPVIMPDFTFEEQARFLWETSTRFRASPASQVIVSTVGSGDIRELLSRENSTHAFRCVRDFMNLASFNQWFVPFPTFMRLACLHLYLGRVHANCSSRLLENPRHQNDLYWTFWLHSQHVDHQKYLI